jgi:hypothetical protein
VGIFIIFSYLHIEKIYGLLRFGLLIEDDQLVYLCFCATYMVCTVCIDYTGIMCMYFGWHVKDTVLHEVDISIVAGIISFVKKTIEKSHSA